MSKREEIAPNGDKRYIRRDGKGQIKTLVEEGRSLSERRAEKSGCPQLSTIRNLPSRTQGRAPEVDAKV